MIRTTIIVVLTLGAVGTFILLAVNSGTVFPKTYWIPPAHEFKLEWECGAERAQGNRWLSVCAGGGRFSVHYTATVDTSVEVEPAQSIRVAGFRLFRTTLLPPKIVREVQAQYMRYGASGPVWLTSLLLVTYPLIAYIRGPLRRWRRRRRGMCLSCGYDLTGNESGVCPECGTEIEKP
ncbi:MAG: hypothetical protein JSU63_07550 [Phycisphaerales bacterium]|nr:MAG: hypothetical protein JSU63_07550 [Phycisphaerales bacterium]